MSVTLTTQSIEVLIDEQRELLNNQVYSTEVCHHNMSYLKSMFNKSQNIFNSGQISVNTNLLKQTKTCSICLEEHPFNDLLRTECNHYFGKSCYERWVASNNSCPYCRNQNPRIFLFAENNL